MDRESRPRVRQEKRALRRLIRLAEDNPEWALGYEDETWWSRFEQPSLHSWAEAGEPMRLVQKEANKDDPDPKALSCYGLYLPELGRTWLRFVDGRPVSAITTQFLSWSCQKLEELGKKALLLVWDNASWHKSKFVKEWIAAHNWRVKERGSGVRIVVPCFLPKQSPWLNAIEPKWVHGKRKVLEPEAVLTAHELADRVCEVFGCTHEPHLSIPQEVA